MEPKNNEAFPDTPKAPKRGRPRKTADGLTNDIKVRIDDATLAELDKYCEVCEVSRADAIRRALDDLLIFPTGNEDFQTYFNKIGFTLQLVTERLELLKKTIPALLKSLGTQPDVRDDCIAVLAKEAEGIRAAADIWNGLIEEAQKSLELKNKE